MACAHTKVPFLGIEWQEHRHDGDDLRGATVVSRVLDDTPAQKAGLSVGDVIRSVDGVAVSDENTLTRLIMQHKPGSQVALEVQRGLKRMTVKVTLGTRSVPQLKFAPTSRQP